MSSVQKLKNGKFQVSFERKRAGVSRTKRTFNTSEEANEWLRRLKILTHPEPELLGAGLLNRIYLKNSLFVLARAAELCTTNIEETKKLLAEADKIVVPEEAPLFFPIKGIIESHAYCYEILKRELVWWNNLEINGIQKRFAANLKYLIPGARLIETFNHNRFHRPDFFIEVNGNLRVVEIKKDVIDKKARIQVLRYINIYKVDIGYVVAPRCSVELPENVHFIKCE